MATIYGKLGVASDLEPTSDKRFELGETARGPDGTVYQYVQATAATIAQYAAVAITEANRAAELTKSLADENHRVGFAQTAFTASYYGWVAISGLALRCKLAASCAANVVLYTTGTAGVLDDASTSQTKIIGVAAVASITAATNAAIIANYPQRGT